MHMYLLGAAAKQTFADSVAGKVTLLALTAILGFASAFVLEQIKRKREPHKQISWDMDIERGLVAVSPSVKERVEVLYRNRPTNNLLAVRFKASNTGNQVVKSQYIRFEFSRLTTILDEDLDPPPPRELGAEQARIPELQQNETRYVIKHLERGQEVNFLFVVDGEDAGPPSPHPYNEEGDVSFIPRDVARVDEDTEHVQPFVFWTFFFLVIPTIFTSISGGDYPFSNAFLAGLRIVLLVPILPHVPAIARLAQRCVSRLVAEVKASQEVRISGRNFAFLSENSTLSGEISFEGDGSAKENPSLTEDDRTPNALDAEVKPSNPEELTR